MTLIIFKYYYKNYSVRQLTQLKLTQLNQNQRKSPHNNASSSNFEFARRADMSQY
jgi:hypothetical protein